jgi:uncharacterized protein (DUF1015 family)
MEIRPFRGWRYAGTEDGDVSAQIAPPYDVLSGEDKQQLLAGSAENIVGVDLPHVPPKQVGPEAAYLASAQTLRTWQDSGVVRQEPAPAIYVYEQSYEWAGKKHTRTAMLAGVRATPLGEDVIPHEHTFAGPKADRLMLTRHTGMQLSPIFGFYEDPSEQVENLLKKASQGPPSAHGLLRGVEEKLWVLDDANVVAQIASSLKETKVFIADGHHRYTTALNYRDALASEGGIDAEHPANFVMFALVARQDPGLLVLPTHRIVRNLVEEFTLAGLVEATDEFEWSKISAANVDLSDADAFLSPYGEGAMAFVGGASEEIWIARLRDPEAMRKVAPEECDAWRALNVSILQKLIIEKALRPWLEGEPQVDYTPEGQEVLEECHSGLARLGICLQSTPVDAVERIALAGASMPHKSTYFYPKLATGMVWKPVG